jgi:hypothetical protein
MFYLLFPLVLMSLGGLACTIFGSAWRLRTNPVHWNRLGEIATSITLIGLLQTAEVLAANPASIGALQQQQASGWLQLKQDQKTYREGVEPLAPPAAKSLDRLERRQQTDMRQLWLRQRQALDAIRNRQRGAEAQDQQSHRIRLESQRQLDRQRLEMRIQRETLRPGLR